MKLLRACLGKRNLSIQAQRRLPELEEIPKGAKTAWAPAIQSADELEEFCAMYSGLVSKLLVASTMGQNPGAVWFVSSALRVFMFQKVFLSQRQRKERA